MLNIVSSFKYQDKFSIHTLYFIKIFRKIIFLNLLEEMIIGIIFNVNKVLL